MTGTEIRTFRERERISQCLLARMLGTGHDTVSKWESGQTKPSDTYKTKIERLMRAAPEELDARRDEVRREQAEERRKRRCANPVKPKELPKLPEKEAAKPVEPAKPATTKTANPCKTCPYWQHMDGQKSKTMYCAYLQETGHVRTCGAERTYQRHRALSPLSLDAARAAELGVSYGAYKAGGVI